jgi:hypothetical protein
MAGTVIKRVIQSLKKLKPKPKPKKTWSKKNVGIGKIKDQKLYKTLGKDKYGDVQIITKGPQKGYRVPLDKKGFTERRPWAADKSYKPSHGERVPTEHYGATKKASGGLIERSGYRGGGSAVRGFGRAMKKGGKV